MYYRLVRFSFVPEHTEMINVAILLENDYTFRLLRDKEFKRLAQFMGGLSENQLKYLNVLFDYAERQMSEEGKNDEEAFRACSQVTLTDWVELTIENEESIAEALKRFLNPLKGT